MALRLIKHTDSRLQENLDGNYKLLCFETSDTSVGTGSNIIFFKFEKEVTRNIHGNGYFVADGYLFDTLNMTSNFKYFPTTESDVQILKFKNLRNLNVSFCDKTQNVISINNWSMLLKKC